MKLNDAIKEVMKLAEEKDFPRTPDKLPVLFNRISIELGEAMDEYHKDSLLVQEEMVDVLIQVFQVLGVLRIDTEFVFKIIMERNKKRDFSRHKKL